MKIGMHRESDLSEEKIKRIREDYLYWPQLTLKDISCKHNITMATLTKLKGEWQKSFIKGVQRRCADCGSLYIANRRNRKLCIRCQNGKKGIPQTLGLPRVVFAVKREKPKLEIGRRYKFTDPEYGTRSEMVKTGKLVQVTEHFAVFDTGRYKTSVEFENIKEA